MNLFVLQRKCTTQDLCFLFLPAILVLVMNSATAGKSISPNPGRYSDSILVHKQIINKKYKVRLYPDANHKVLFFSASGEAGKIYQLYLFDMEGKLVQQVGIKQKQTTIIKNLEKGHYLFEVLSDDERVVNGHVSIQ
jgi:hypothetical protein